MPRPHLVVTTALVTAGIATTFIIASPTLVAAVSLPAEVALGATAPTGARIAAQLDGALDVDRPDDVQKLRGDVEGTWKMLRGRRGGRQPKTCADNASRLIRRRGGRM